MTILVINSGSSSLKFQVIDSENEEVLAKGVCERIGIDGRFTYRTRTGISLKEAGPKKNHTPAGSNVAGTVGGPGKGGEKGVWGNGGDGDRAGAGGGEG